MPLFSFIRSQSKDDVQSRSQGLSRSRTASPQPAESTTPTEDPRNEQDAIMPLSGATGQQQQHQAETEAQTDAEGDQAAGEQQQDDAEKGEDEDDMVNWPDLFFDPADEIWRCRACGWEVNHGECDGCHERFHVTRKLEIADHELDIANDDPLDPESGDRDPPPHPDAPSPLPSSTPDLLSSLGVPPAMQDRFKIEYSNTHGIIATADAPLRTRFNMHPTQVVEQDAADGSGPVEVVVKRPWKIHLGSRVRLAMADEDGSEFMRDLVEAMYEQQSGGGDRTRLLGEVKVGEYVTVVEEREVVVEADDSDAGDGSSEAAGGGQKTVVEVEWVTRRLEEDEELEEADEVLAELEREEDGEDEAMSGIDDSPEGELPGPLGSSDEELEEEEGSAGEGEAQAGGSTGAEDVKEEEESSDLEVLSAGEQDEEGLVIIDDDDAESSQKSGSSEL